MRVYTFLAFFLTAVLTASAAERPATKMRQAALRTLNKANAKSVLSRPTLEVYSDGSHFSVVSRDDRFPEVLAYGFGDFNFEQIPANVKWWYESIQKAMEKAEFRAVPTRSVNSYPAVEPMLYTKWGQGVPYNNYAPVTDNTKAPAGCVAVAMGQVMNFCQYPLTASFTGRYMVEGEQGERIVAVNSTYTWPYLSAYSNYMDENGRVVPVSTTTRQGNQVAALLRDCGYSVNMLYSAMGSGAVSTYVAGALVNCFGYPDKAVKYRERMFYTDEEWEEMIYGELQKGTPLIYSGVDANSGDGHAFIVHGMDENGLLCINWGWNGLYDGYYEYRLLNPDVEEFSLMQDMTFGIRSEALEDDHYESMLGGKLYSFAYDNTNKEFILNNEEFYNYGGLDIVGRVAVVAENLTIPAHSVYIDFIEPGDTLEVYYGFGQFTDKIGITFPEGHYRLYIASLDYRETEWQVLRTLTDGAVYYDMTVNAAGTVSISKTPNRFTTTGIAFAKENISNVDENAPLRYYDLHGREVGSDSRGLVIMKQGGTVRKIYK